MNNDIYRVDNLSVEDVGYEAIVGSMFSGKTDETIRRVNRLRHAGLEAVVIRPDLDFLNKNALTSHGGTVLVVDQKFVSHKNPEEALSFASKYDYFAFDEGQFYTSPVIVEVLLRLAFLGKRVTVNLLDKDFAGLPFNYAPLIIASAVKVTVLTAICSVCGAQATMTQRLNEVNRPVTYEDELTVVGNQEMREDLKTKKTRRYQARCRRHHVLLSPGGERVVALGEGVYVNYSELFRSE